jgi:hypothetical protein
VTPAGQVVPRQPAGPDRLVAGADDQHARLLARRVAQVLHRHGQELGHAIAVLRHLSQRLVPEHPLHVGAVRAKVKTAGIFIDPHLPLP